MHGVGEEEALVQTKMDPCSDKMVLCYVASVCKFGTDLDGLYFSFRCRWPGACGNNRSTHPRPAPGGVDPRRGPRPPALAGGERDSKGGGESERLLLWRLFDDFLAGQKVIRGPGPGRPRRLQICRRFAPGPAGPDKKEQGFLRGEAPWKFARSAN